MSITKQQIEDMCDTLDEFGSGTYETEHGVFHVLGLRAQAQSFTLGPISHKSINDPDDQEPEQLNGICTYGIGVGGCNAQEAIDLTEEFHLPHMAIIAGNEYEDSAVNDPDEVIIMDPVVIKIIK